MQFGNNNNKQDEVSNNPIAKKIVNMAYKIISNI